MGTSDCLLCYTLGIRCKQCHSDDPNKDPGGSHPHPKPPPPPPPTPIVPPRIPSPGIPTPTPSPFVPSTPAYGPPTPEVPPQPPVEPPIEPPIEPPVEPSKPPTPSIPVTPVPVPPPLPPIIPMQPDEEGESSGIMRNDDLPNFGLPLSCFTETLFGKTVVGCFDERGVRYTYLGPAHPNSTTTIFGVWTGPAPFANDIPSKIKGREKPETSGLDSFSLLYTILCYTFGHHVREIDDEYVARIQAAITRGVISPIKNVKEFDSSLRIVRSFQRTGHIFDAVNAFGQTEYATRLGSVPRDSKWMAANAEMSYPMFKLSDTQQQQMKEAFIANPGVMIEDLPTLLKFMESANLTSSYPYLWLSQRQFNTLQSEFAFKSLQEEISTLNPRSESFPTWIQREKNDPFKQAQSTVSLHTLVTDLTASILENLL